MGNEPDNMPGSILILFFFNSPMTMLNNRSAMLYQCEMVKQHLKPAPHHTFLTLELVISENLCNFPPHAALGQRCVVMRKKAGCNFFYSIPHTTSVTSYL